MLLMKSLTNIFYFSGELDLMAKKIHLDSVGLESAKKTFADISRLRKGFVLAVQLLLVFVIIDTLFFYFSGSKNAEFPLGLDAQRFFFVIISAIGTLLALLSIYLERFLKSQILYDLLKHEKKKKKATSLIHPETNIKLSPKRNGIEIETSKGVEILPDDSLPKLEELLSE